MVDVVEENVVVELFSIN